MYLRCFVQECPKRWLELLPWAEFSYNTSFHSAIGMTPVKAVYGREPPLLVRGYTSADTPPDIHALLRERDLLLTTLKRNLQCAQNRMKRYADRHRREDTFQVGDFVLVKLQPYRQHSVALRKHQKLGFKYFGPFKVIERIGTVAYRLELPPSARIHTVFHISLLKRCYGDVTSTYVPLPLLADVDGPQVQPLEVLQTRQVQHGDSSVTQALIRWEGISEPTWEDLQSFLHNYPAFDLGDKVTLVGEGNVTSTISSQQMSGELNHDVAIPNDGHTDLAALRRSTRPRTLTWKLREGQEG